MHGPPKLVLAHVIVGIRMIAETAARVLSGGQPRFDNRAMAPALIHLPGDAEQLKSYSR